MFTCMNWNEENISMYKLKAAGKVIVIGTDKIGKNYNYFVKLAVGSSTFGSLFF